MWHLPLSNPNPLLSHRLPQTLGFYFKDQLKSLVLTIVVSLLIAAPVIHIVKTMGEHFYIYAWLFVLAFSLISITVYPDYIAPRFDKYVPRSPPPSLSASSLHTHTGRAPSRSLLLLCPHGCLAIGASAPLCLYPCRSAARFPRVCVFYCRPSPLHFTYSH